MSSVEEKCKETQRRDTWDDGEVRILLEVWGDGRVQADLEGTGRNITIYRRSAVRLNRGLGGGGGVGGGWGGGGGGVGGGGWGGGGVGGWGGGWVGGSERTAESCRSKIKRLHQDFSQVSWSSGSTSSA